MKTWSGRIITGDRGASLLTRLSAKANEQARVRAMEAVGQAFSDYQPWMSNKAKRSQWSSLHRIPSLIPDLAALETLRVAFSEGGPLRAISPGNSTQDVCTDPSTCLVFRTRAQALVDKMTATSTDFEIRLAALLFEMIPLTQANPNRAGRTDGEGLSSQTYRGAVFLQLAAGSAYADQEDLLNFAHELGHQAFNLILNADPVIAGNAEQPIYSVIRHTFRPAVMSFHALAAVAYMVEFMCRAPYLFSVVGDREWAVNRLRGLANDLSTGLATIRHLPLTETGQQLLAEFEDLHRLSHEGISRYQIG